MTPDQVKLVLDELRGLRTLAHTLAEIDRDRTLTLYDNVENMQDACMDASALEASYGPYPEGINGQTLAQIDDTLRHGATDTLTDTPTPSDTDYTSTLRVLAYLSDHALLDWEDERVLYNTVAQAQRATRALREKHTP